MGFIPFFCTGQTAWRPSIGSIASRVHAPSIHYLPAVYKTISTPRRTLVVHSFPLATFSSSAHTPEPPPPWLSSFTRSPPSSKPEVGPLDFVVARYFLYCLLLKLGATTSPASSHLPPPATDTSPSYLFFQTLLTLFWTLTCMI